MAVAFRAVGTFASGTSSCSPGLPSGWQANDIHLLLVESDEEATVNTPSGYTFAATAQTGSGTTGVKLTVFARRAVGGDAAPTVTGPTDHIHAVIAGFSGVKQGSAVTASDVMTIGSPGGQIATSCSIPAVTTTVANAMVVGLMASTFNGNSTALWSAWANASLSSTAERQDQAETTGRGGGTGVFTGVKASAGATSATTMTHTTAVETAGLHIALYEGANAYEINAEPGAFSVSGFAADLLEARQLNAEPAAYAVNGVAASATAGRVLSADPAAYAVNGAAATAIAARSLNGEPGAFVVTGVDATATTAGAGVELNAEPGVFTVTGAAADVTSQRVVSADPGSYAVTGVAATLLTARVLSATPGVFTFTGVAADLVYTVPGGSTSRNRTMLGVGL